MLELVRELPLPHHEGATFGEVYKHDGEYIVVSTVALDDHPGFEKNPGLGELRPTVGLPVEGEETYAFPSDEEGEVKWFLPIDAEYGEGSRERLLERLRERPGQHFSLKEQMRRAIEVLPEHATKPDATVVDLLPDDDEKLASWLGTD